MSVPLPGFVQVLKNLDSSGILFDISLALESPRKKTGGLGKYWKSADLEQ